MARSGRASLLPLRYAWRNVLARKGATIVTLVGVGISVMVFVVMGATADSLARIATTTGEPDNVLVVSKGAGGAESSRLDGPTVNGLRYQPGVARDGSGAPLASVELLAMREVPVKGLPPGAPGATRYTTVRGVTPDAFRIHRGVQLVSGRLPRAPGEVLIGRLLPASIGDVRIGDELTFRGRAHTIVGIFAARGQIFEGEIWMALEDLRGRSGEREASAVVLRAADPREVDALVERLESSRLVSVGAKPEPEYYARVQRASAAFVFLGNLIGALMGLGAVVAAANTMFATMSRRIREMGTLRALGFGRWRVAATLLIESALVAAAGGVLGIGLALAFDGLALTLVGLAFELDIDAASARRGLLMALAIGGFGGLLPARSAARLEIVAALRHV